MSIYLRSKRTAIRKALMQTKTQILFRRWKRGVWIKGRNFCGCRDANTVMLILKSVFHVQSGGHSLLPCFPCKRLFGRPCFWLSL